MVYSIYLMEMINETLSLQIKVVCFIFMGFLFLCKWIPDDTLYSLSSICSLHTNYKRKVVVKAIKAIAIIYVPPNRRRG